MKNVEKFKGWLKQTVLTDEWNLVVDNVLAESVNKEKVIVNNKIYKWQDLKEVELQDDKETFKCVFPSNTVEIKFVKIAQFRFGW